MTDDSTAQWKRMRFKNNKVWMALDDARQPLLENGKALIKYQLDQPHQYWVHPSAVHPLDAPPPDQHVSTNSKHMAAQEQATAPHKDGSIRIYTDGASSGNPGPAGIGVVMVYRDKRREISRHIGIATNNVAELEAIRQGLAAVKNRKLPVIIFTDSSYALGILTQALNAKLNQALVADIQGLLKKFKQVRFIKVKGHAGHPENERADRLAVKATQRPMEDKK